MVYTEQLAGGEQWDVGTKSKAAELCFCPLTLPVCGGRVCSRSVHLLPWKGEVPVLTSSGGGSQQVHGGALGGFPSTTISARTLHNKQIAFPQPLGFIMLPCPVLLQVRSRLGGRVLRGVRAYARVSSWDVPPALAVHLSHRLGRQVL